MGAIVTESVETMISADESLEKNQKQKEYLDYINEHILNVQKAFAEYFLPLLDKSNLSSVLSDEELKEGIRKAAVTVKDHDASKFGDEEFDGYREKYYPTATETADPELQLQVEEKSEIAWIHHYHHNWHHPMYWVDPKTNEKLDMNLEAIIEMICDWIAMDMKYHTGVIEWYENKAIKEKKAMTDRTRQLTEEIMYHVIRPRDLRNYNENLDPLNDIL